MLRSRAVAIRCRAFRAPRRCLSPGPSAPKFSPSPSSSSSLREMDGEESLDGYPRSWGSPRIREGVRAVKASVHHSDKASPLALSKSRKEDPACSTNIGNSELCENSPFDICLPQRVDHVRLNLSLLEQNREKRRIERGKVTFQHLRPGMILLKDYLKHNDQVEIIRQCQRLGVGSGGFYQPGYRDGAKLSLQMMCLGKHWDPQTRLYKDIRPTDGARAPQIPGYFKNLVEEAIQISRALIKPSVGECCTVEAEFPNILPDICIVNFYSKNGKLGLHQDRDESPESLEKGLPVVSFSLGDAADFLYGENRDVDKAKDIRLDNGDVLIFGGESRHIFHGISCIHPGTAPKWLVEKTKLRPGRLNLTFRQF